MISKANITWKWSNQSRNVDMVYFYLRLIRIYFLWNITNIPDITCTVHEVTEAWVPASSTHLPPKALGGLNGWKKTSTVGFRKDQHMAITWQPREPLSQGGGACRATLAEEHTLILHLSGGPASIITVFDHCVHHGWVRECSAAVSSKTNGATCSIGLHNSSSCQALCPSWVWRCDTCCPWVLAVWHYCDLDIRWSQLLWICFACLEWMMKIRNKLKSCLTQSRSTNLIASNNAYKLLWKHLVIKAVEAFYDLYSKFAPFWCHSLPSLGFSQLKDTANKEPTHLQWF